MLLLAKGEAVTGEDVHNAWVAWTLSKGEDHEMLVPFSELSSDTQSEDSPYVVAIRAVARRRDEDPLTASRCRAALDQIDTAAIGTLHAFARRILAEHAIAAGLPPRIDVLDEVSSGLAFEQRWAALRDHVLEAAELARPVLLLLALGVPLDALRYLASAFDDNWDLVQDRVPASAPDPPPVGDLVLAALAPLDELCARRHTDCTDDSDTLCERLQEIEAHLTRLRAGLDDEAELVRALHDEELPSFKVGRSGRRASWTELAELRQAVGEAGEILPGVRDRVGQACTERLAPTVRASTLDGARRRREDGRLEYHDLLVLSRQLLTDPHHGPAVRSALHHRYRHILLDEFQDTDPIQAVRIAAADSGSVEAGAGRGPRSTSSPATSSWSATRSSRSTASGGPTSRCGWPPRPATGRRPVEPSS